MAAVGSFLDARSQGAEWLVRIEDVDRAREVQGAADSILRTLEDYALNWDGAVWRQSTRSEAYAAALAELDARRLTYRCSCSRAELAGASAADPESEPRYPGRCRTGPRDCGGPHAIRFRVDGFPAQTIRDRLQPILTQSVDATTGDFIVRRRDGYFAYQLAVVVDDAAQGITDVVRGCDLYDNTPRQRLLQQALGLAEPSYLHLPLVLDRRGSKLAKSRGALPASAAAASQTLSVVLGWFGISTPEMLRGAPPHALLQWATTQWNIDLLQGVKEVFSEP